VALGLKNKAVRVTLIDKKNHHTFQPLLYQVATTVLSPGQIATSLRHIVRKSKNIEVLLGEVSGFDFEAKRVKVNDSPDLPYDYLVICAGSRHSYFGHDEWEKFAPGLKTVEDAVEIRRRILMAFEEAERESFYSGKTAPLTFAVIGGGPTGVEVAGAIADIARRAVAHDYKSIDTTQTKVVLFEGTGRILGMFPEDLGLKAEKQLKELGVELRKNAMVSDVQEGRIKVCDEWIETRLTVWTTGVAANPLGKKLGVPTARNGTVAVQPDLTLEGHPDVFILGDMATLKDAHGVQVPALGASATQEGQATAKNILRDLAKQPRKPFVYKDKGTMSTIGRNRAVALIGKVELTGLFAWLSWSLVHVYLLVGFRNKLFVMWDWVWAYFTRERSSGLITGNNNPPPPNPNSTT